MGRHLRHAVDRFSSILLIIPVIILVWADATGLVLSQATHIVLAAYFVFVSGINISTWAKQATAIVSAVGSVQRALEAADEDDDEDTK